MNTHLVPSFDLTGRLAVVTGGGRGLGRSIALALGSMGADVAVVARSEEQVKEVAASLLTMGRRSYALTCDLAHPDRVTDLAAMIGEQCGTVDVIVHAAGVQVRKPAMELVLAEWDRVFSVNVTSAFFLSNRLMELQSQPVDRHIFVASLTSSIGIANTSAYAASKSAVLGVVRSLAIEWAPLGVTVNAVQPGYFRTELTEAVFADPQRQSWINSRIPMGRVGVGEDLVGAVVFLASEAGGYITGQSLVVDGGWLAS